MRQSHLLDLDIDKWDARVRTALIFSGYGGV
jgi:hypothetical protein